MKISTKGRYALRLMVDLAKAEENEYVSLRGVALRQEISMKYLEQIVSQLTKAGQVQSVRGPQGGYRLTRDPSQYTIGEILRVTEGSIAPGSCVDSTPNRCVRAGQCEALPVWEGLYEVIQNYVDSVTLQDVVDNMQISDLDIALP